MVNGLFQSPISIPSIEWGEALFSKKKLHVSILRTDLIHPALNGNKYFKLKYNLQAYFQSGCNALLTFGGAYSNHIYATAAAGLFFKIPTVGIIRGDELNTQSNFVLRFAQRSGMRLKFVSREYYRHKEDADVLSELRKEFGDVYILPEGGTNELAMKGTSEIMQSIPRDADWIGCACGTGGTLAGLARVLSKGQRLLGVSSLNAPGYFETQLMKFNGWNIFPENIFINYNFHFGGYGKVNVSLKKFCDEFADANGYRPDEIYNAKLFYAFRMLAEKDYFSEGSNVVLVHTGGISRQPIQS